MKSIHLLTRQVDQWWRIYIAEAPQIRQPGKSQVSSKSLIQSDPTTPNDSGNGRKSRNFRSHPSAVLLVAIVSLTSTIGYRFYNAPKLDVGTIAPETILAPETAEVPDIKSTDEKRKQERIGAIPILKLDQVVNEEIYQNLYQILTRGNKLRSSAGAFPFASESVLSLSTQQYLRQTQEWAWRMVLQAVNWEMETEDRPKDASDRQERIGEESSPSVASLEKLGNTYPQFPQLQPTEMNQAIAALQRYQQGVDARDFQNLLDKISQVRRDYNLTLTAMRERRISEARTIYDASFLDRSDAVWEKTKVGIKESTARILAQGIPKGLPDNLLRNAIAMQVSAAVPAETELLALEILLTVLEPNLMEDAEETKRRAEQAASAVEPVLVQVKAGEAIVTVGQEITHERFVLIDYFELSQREINWQALTGFGILVSGAIAVFWLVERRFHPRMRRRDHLLVLLLTLSAPLLASLKIPYASLPAIGLLAGSFYGSALGVTTVGLLSVVLPVGMEIGWSDWLASAAGGLLGGLMAGRMRSREEVALLGVGVGFAQGIVYLIVTLIISAAANLVWPTVLGAAALRSVGGIAWSIVALGLSPYLEHLFDLVTPVRLAELANPNRPLLQRLAAETPGTFQHTLFVSTLAEAATRALGGNVELVRAGTLYHDIGKMHDPLGFIENQMGGPNKHDEINDPWKSAQIIKKHVTEGLVMARKHRLPKSIQEFIPEHQGTMSIAYFYHQAKQMAEKEPSIVVQESDFRYPGPIPQSRETGIVMLADSCEAALRSLKDATYEEAIGMVNKILRARWQDNQLVDSGLKREEMPVVADVFVRVWQQFHHKRIAYPKGALGCK